MDRAEHKILFLKDKGCTLGINLGEALKKNLCIFVGSLL